MRKKLVNNRPKYSPGDILYAINIYHSEEEKEDFYRIEKVRVVSITITSTDIEYYLINIKDDIEWGDTVPEVQVNINKDELVKYIFKLMKI